VLHKNAYNYSVYINHGSVFKIKPQCFGSWFCISLRITSGRKRPYSVELPGPITSNLESASETSWL
jgi:hypothetical protein